jgi:hypothetical protein
LQHDPMIDLLGSPRGIALSEPTQNGFIESLDGRLRD